jgi:serine/threonine-protein kinase
LIVKLVDFGIAKPIDAHEAARTALTTTGQALGTPYTMAPEQITGKPLDGRTDVYALGIMIFEMLTGKKPFSASSALEVADMHLRTPPPHAHEIAPVSPAIDSVIQRCLAKAPAQRYDNPDEVVTALQIASRRRVTPAIKQSVRARTVQAMGLHYEVRLNVSEEEVGEDVFAEIEDMLAAAHAECSRVGLRIAMTAGNGFLAVAPLPTDGPRALEMRARVIEVAMALSQSPEQSPAPGRLRVNVSLHRAPVVTAFTQGNTEFIGGDLMTVGNWVAQEPTQSAVVVTHAALEGCEDRFSLQPLPGQPAHRRILGPRS